MFFHEKSATLLLPNYLATGNTYVKRGHTIFMTKLKNNGLRLVLLTRVIQEYKIKIRTYFHPSKLT